jgi:isoleucyl-tRNA synthetase
LSDRGVTVAVDAALTPELRAEGLAREFVRRVQDLRKSAGLEVSDRIRLACQASPTLADALTTWRAYIMSETLALELNTRVPPVNWASAADKFDGEMVTFGLIKAEPGEMS